MEDISDTLEVGVVLFECLSQPDAVHVIKLLKSKLHRKQEKKQIKLSNGEYRTIETISYYGKCGLYNFYYSDEHYCLNIMLEHGAVVDRLADTIIVEVKAVLHNYFGIEYTILNHFKFNMPLMRIEFNRDYEYRHRGIFYLIKRLLTIAPRYIQSKHYKIDTTDNENEYTVTYKSHSNRTVQVKIYNKDMEQLQQLKHGKISRSQYNNYRNTLRIEVKVKNGKLNAEKNKYYIPKDLYTYLDEYVANHYFDKYVSQIVFSENFYRIDIAIEMIKNDQTLSSSMRDKLCNLLKTINEKGYTYTKENYPYKSAFNEHIKKIRERNINPLTLDEELGKDWNVEVLENFTLKQNCKHGTESKLF